MRKCINSLQFEQLEQSITLQTKLYKFLTLGTQEVKKDDSHSKQILFDKLVLKRPNLAVMACFFKMYILIGIQVIFNGFIQQYV